MKHLKENKIIADFMEWEFRGGNALVPNHYPWEGYESGWIECDISHLQFGISWDWLMPVWERFRGRVWESGGYTNDFNAIKAKFLTGVFNGSIDEAHSSLMEGINWYNQAIKP